MAASPKWKVYRDGEYVAACKYAEDAAALAGVLSFGDRTEVRCGHSQVVWREGHEKQPARESYDFAASVMTRRAGRV